MKLSSLKSLFSRTTPVPAQKESPLTAAWLRGEDVAPDNSPVLTNAYQQVVWVYRAINVLAEQVANIPFLFSNGERGRESLITSGPLIDFYRRPHPMMNRFQYWETRITWLMLRGECFRVPVYESSSRSRNADLKSAVSQVSNLQGSHNPQLPSVGYSSYRNRNMKLSHVLFLDPAQMHHIIDNHRLVGWRYTGNNLGPLESQCFLPEEVWFDKLTNPFDFWRGMSPLFVAQFPARTDFAASSFMRGTMENNADTGLIVRSDQLVSDEEREQILAHLRNRKRRAGVSDRPIFLHGVNEIVKPDLSSADMQFLENRKFSRSEICAAFGVPEEVITSTEKAKFDVMAGSRINFIENRVGPLCNRLAAEEERIVKAIDPNATGWFDIDSLPIMQDARRQRLTACLAAFQMGIPFNETNG
jgi:HK97 family phage portal protein